ncbi:MAG TPA: DinB family protein [Candidatus Xenobia bacterium]|jgi:uncharacterized damage-inducible protein DinB
MLPSTLAELFTFNDWARDRLLDDLKADLDAPFEMGEGSLRKTLQHLWEAEEVWLNRWNGLSVKAEPPTEMEELRDRFLDTAGRRNAWVAAQTEGSLGSSFTFKRRGHTATMPRGLTALHVLNHGIHHRAQAVNMLKRLGVEKPPNVDYLVMRLHGGDPSVDRNTVDRWFDYSDWAFNQVFKAASELSDEARKAQHPLGPGSIHRIMHHMADAPGWWVDSYEGRREPFPAIVETEPWNTILPRYQAGSDRIRNLHLNCEIEIIARGSTHRIFPMRVVALQLCSHGTQHRAQALNMIRRAGGKVPDVDLADWLETVPVA